jgi:Flp pilus assembly protein CpaB
MAKATPNSPQPDVRTIVDISEGKCVIDNTMPNIATLTLVIRQIAATRRAKTGDTPRTQPNNRSKPTAAAADAATIRKATGVPATSEKTNIITPATGLNPRRPRTPITSEEYLIRFRT